MNTPHHHEHHCVSGALNSCVIYVTRNGRAATAKDWRIANEARRLRVSLAPALPARNVIGCDIDLSDLIEQNAMFATPDFTPPRGGPAAAVQLRKAA